MLIFCKRYADISKNKEVLLLKDVFSETTYMCVLMYKFQVANIGLTSFRQGVILPPTHPTHTHTTKGTPKKPTQIRVKRIEVPRNVI